MKLASINLRSAKDFQYFEDSWCLVDTIPFRGYLLLDCLLSQGVRKIFLYFFLEVGDLPQIFFQRHRIWHLKTTLSMWGLFCIRIFFNDFFWYLFSMSIRILGVGQRFFPGWSLKSLFGPLLRGICRYLQWLILTIWFKLILWKFHPIFSAVSVNLSIAPFSRKEEKMLSPGL